MSKYDVLRKEIKKLKKEKNVNAAYIGKKEKNGKKTDEIAICFDVEKKKDISELTQEEYIPPEVKIDGETYKTDVKESQEIVALSCWTPGDPEILRLRGNPNLLSPIKGGQEIVQFPTGWTYSAPNFGFTVGTLGFIAVDNIDDRVVGVTNAHVVIPPEFLLLSDERNISDAGEPYNTIEEREWTLPDVPSSFIQNGDFYFPGAVLRDGSSIISGAEHIKRHIPFSAVDDNFVDAALLIMDPSQIDSDSYQIHQPTTEAAFTAFLPFATTSEIDDLLDTPPSAVYSTGRTTGPKGWGVSPSCVLEVTGLAGSANVDFGSGVIPFDDLIRYEYQDGSGGAVLGGDSGSALLAVIGGVRKIIGLVFAGTPSGNIALAVRIDRVADALDIREWDGSYFFNTDVPNPVIQVVNQSDSRSGDASILDSNSDTVYQAGITDTTGYDEIP